MQYWRMQLHPSESHLATRHAAESIVNGFIGLDFAQDVGDMRRIDRSELPRNDYPDFALRMSIGDYVLIMAHHFPFALVKVDSDYLYVSDRQPELGVWFRHFRRIDKSETRYYADYVKNAHEWERIPMTDTISILIDPGSKSYQLIDSWRGG